MGACRVTVAPCCLPPRSAAPSPLDAPHCVALGSSEPLALVGASIAACPWDSSVSSAGRLPLRQGAA